MIETSINQLTAAIVRLCDLIENKQLMLPLFGEQKATPNATNPQESEKKSTRGKKATHVTDAPAPEPPAPTEEPTPEVPEQEPPTPDCGTEPTACCDEPAPESVATSDEPIVYRDTAEQPTTPTITHETCTNLVKEYRRHNAHLLAAKKINHTEMLRIVNQRFGIEAVSKCPDDKLPALYDALKAICQPIEP